MEIGATLRKLREKRGLSLQDVALRANVSPGHVSRWELGTRNLDFADYIKLCAILEVLPGDLLEHTAGVPLRYRELVSMLEDRPDIELQRVINVVAAIFGDVHRLSDVESGNTYRRKETRTAKSDEPGVAVESSRPQHSSRRKPRDGEDPATNEQRTGKPGTKRKRPHVVR